MYQKVCQKVAIALLLLTMVFAGPLFAADNDALIFGVHPFKKPTELVKMFKPVADFIGQELGKEVKIVVGKSYEETMEKFKSGEYDFGYFGPAPYAILSQTSQVVPLARIQNKGKGTFKGVLVVKQDSPIAALTDLKGKSFAFVDKSSTLGHYVPHDMLLAEGISLADLSKYAFIGSHENVAKNVLLGRFDAGALKPSIAKKYLDQGLKILAESNPIPNHLFLSSSQLDAGVRQQVKQALLKADVSLLTPIKSSITGLEEVAPGDYDALRTLLVKIDKEDPPK